MTVEFLKLAEQELYDAHRKPDYWVDRINNLSTK